MKFNLENKKMSVDIFEIDNYDLLDLCGMIENAGDRKYRLSSNIVVLRDDDDTGFLGKPKIFPLSDIFEQKVFTMKELESKLKIKQGDLSNVRVFLAHFRTQEDGKLSQKRDYWVKFKAWRYDIDDPSYTLEQVIELCDKLPLLPSVIKKSHKGWHLIYAFDKFIERQEVEAYKGYNEKYFLPYKVYEILTELLPFYLKELEPKIDVQASNNVSKIATRFVNGRLPGYYFRLPLNIVQLEYSLETFYNEYSFLSKKTFKYDISYDLDKGDLAYNDEKSTFTVSDISKEEFYAAISRCSVLKILDEDWENHMYEEWFLMTTVYAIKILYAENDEEKEKLKQEFHEKSSRHKNYRANEAEYMLNKIIEYQKQGLKIHGCKTINERIDSRYVQVCKSCPYRKVDKDGNVYGHYLFSYLYRDSLEDEDIKIDGWVLRENGWNKYIANSDTYIQVLPYFKIRSYFIIGNDENEFIEIVDKRGRSYIKPVERKHSYKPNINILIPFGEINPLMEHDAKAFLATYIEKVKIKRGVIIEFVGYKYISNNSWDIVVAGYGKFSRKEIPVIFYGKQKMDDWFIPEVKGNSDDFKLIYRELYRLQDIPLDLMIAHFLSWIGREFLKDKLLFVNINPLLLVVGDTQTGKSIRAKAAAALYGNTALFSFSNITQATFSNRFPLISAPFCVDEVILKSDYDERKFAELIYNITNIQGKMTFNNTYDPIKVPVIVTGETESLPVGKVFDTFRGLNRRTIVVEMTDVWKKNTDAIIKALEGLQLHHGHILGYVQSLKEEDKTEILELMQDFKKEIDFGYGNFQELSNHLALSLAMYVHFYHHYIGIDKLPAMGHASMIINYITHEIDNKQLNRIGGKVNYVEEIINFIAKVEEAMNSRKSLKYLSYERLCSAIGYTPSNTVGKLLKKFFWKKYTSSSSTSTHLRFYPSILIINPFDAFTDEEKAEKFAILQTDKDRLMELSDDELKIWADILKIRYNNDVINKILDNLGNERLKKIIKTDNVKIKC